MPKKPTSDFGRISFGKDGSVHKEIERLSDDKDRQELAIAQRFAARLGARKARSYRVEQLAENDQDFLLYENKKIVAVVQQTEITRHDYTWPLTRDEYDNRPPAHMIYLSENEIYGVDSARYDALLVNKILHKKNKNYQKPQSGEFWLLIWTVWQGPTFVFNETEKERCVIEAEEYLQRDSTIPFDRVWVFSVSSNPYCLEPMLKSDNVTISDRKADPPREQIVTINLPTASMNLDPKN